MARTLRFSEIRAVLFDVDGTLYAQRPLRIRMLRELLALPLRSPQKARSTWRAIRAVRQTLEDLRDEPPGSGLRELRFVRAAERVGMEPAALREIALDWMYDKPLPHIAKHARPGMQEFVGWLAAQGRRIGVLSDYPCVDKLRVLGIERRVGLRLCCDDADIDALKPWPDGFRRAAEIWGVPTGHVLYVGDRPSVDGAGAKAAGMPCVILGKSGLGRSFVGVASFAELRRRLEESAG